MQNNLSGVEGEKGVVDKLLSGIWHGLGVALVVVVGAGCASDLYAPCTLDEESADQTVRQCAQGGSGSRKLSCRVLNQIQCDTRVCARYEGSASFCTLRCQDDADCPAGRCLEFPFQSGEAYCVEETDV